MNKKLILILILVGICAISHVSASDDFEGIGSDISNDTLIQSVEESDEPTISMDEEVSVSSEDSKTYNITQSDNIQDAIDNAHPGDTINLSGTFELDTSVIIDKSITIIGSGALVKSKQFTDAPTLFIITPSASKVVLSDLKFYSCYSNGAIRWEGNEGSIKNCEFYKNTALGNNNGGALVLKGNNCNVTNCSFEENNAQNGGAISLEGDNCQITKCVFIKNRASKNGGAVFVSGDGNTISQCEFYENYVSNPIEGNTIIGGGAIYANKTLTIDVCRFNNNKANASYGGAIYLNYHGIIRNSYFNGNSALQGNDIAVNPEQAPFVQIKYNNVILDFKESVSQSIYGIDESIVKSEDNHNVFTKTRENSKVNFVTGMIFDYGSTGSVSVIVYGGKIEMSNIRVLNHPEAKIKFSNNVLKVSGLAVGKYTLRVTTTPDDDHNSVNSDLIITVNKAPAAIKATKTTVALKKSGKFSVTIIDSNTGKGIASMKVTLKVYTGKKYKKVTLKTNSKGIVKYQTKKLSKGSHKVTVSAVHKGYKFYPVTTQIKVVKQKAIKFRINKKTYKDGATLSIKILNAKKKPINGVKVKLLIYTGSKLVRTEILKSLTWQKEKGVVGYATNELSVGKHNVKILPYDIKYTGSAKSSLNILKSAKKYEQITTRISAKV